ncbi:hypothetical protein CR203_19110 [Salipaludibacillus neizhouensis]|uniref:HTH tetR-type domain-containing protein n=1 Tax=Salipaludibacillus neizhouensis TaxID=885475 RepID=A0A3A9K3B3_9BACI|nr:TetR/AcrR family transcriptional regulator [Salipaludibacillus neizhouensis]RKL65758.1 hypothetical protein CR203_19110 [Salipaludibacillus neizhouensis]
MSNSTKDEIKKKALLLFASQGYDGTSMKDIAMQVGIKTPSIYAHFNGKEELLFSIYEELANEYMDLINEMMNAAEDMSEEAQLYYIFERYITYYMKYPEIQSFWNQITVFTPPQLKETFFDHVTNYNYYTQDKIEKIFIEGIEKGVFRNGNPKQMALSFRIMMEGVFNYMMVVQEISDDNFIRDLWTDLWLGLKK